VDLILDFFNGIRRLGLEGDGFTGEGFAEDLHWGVILVEGWLDLGIIDVNVSGCDVGHVLAF